MVSMGRGGCPSGPRTFDMNFLQTSRISWFRVAENIMTCFSWGVCLKIIWTSRRMSANYEKKEAANTG